MTSRRHVWEDGVVDLPEVAALRARADGIVAAELVRLRRRRPELSDEQGADVSQTLHRIVRRILHHPTMLVCGTLDEPSGGRYRSLLSELFDLTTPPPTATTGPAADVLGPVATTYATNRPTSWRVRPDPRPAHRAVAQVSSSNGRPRDIKPDTITTV